MKIPARTPDRGLGPGSHANMVACRGILLRMTKTRCFWAAGGMGFPAESLEQEHAFVLPRLTLLVQPNEGAVSRQSLDHPLGFTPGGESSHRLLSPYDYRETDVRRDPPTYLRQQPLFEPPSDVGRDPPTYERQHPFLEQSRVRPTKIKDRFVIPPFDYSRVRPTSSPRLEVLPIEDIRRPPRSRSPG